MARIRINHKLVKNPLELQKLCPFSAIDYVNEYLQINSACKMCRLCVKNGPAGVFEYIEEEQKKIDKSIWKGIAVFIEYTDGHIHPVSLELAGKARKMAEKTGEEVFALFPGHDISGAVSELLHYGFDRIFVCDHEKLQFFRVEPYAAVFSEFISSYRPGTVLVGGTETGRSLAPRIAARFRTGLTADCTVLDMSENTDLDQIRPAFGGNIMAHIHTPNHRPQFATVRPKIFDAPQRTAEPSGQIVVMNLQNVDLSSAVNVICRKKKEVQSGIEDAEVLIVAGRALKKQEDFQMIEELAGLLNGKTAATRPLIEAGFADPRTQIGLSGRTVKPKLIITCGVSGAVQFVAGMQNSECIIAINKDENAPVFKVAHYAIIGDVYEIIPDLIRKLKNRKQEQ